MNKTIVFGLTLISLTGCLFLMFSMYHGMGVTPDSVAYLSLADSIHQGKFVSFDGTVSAHWPPLYPLFLSLFEHPISAARFTNIFFFLFAVLLFCIILSRFISSTFLILLGTSIYVFSQPIQTIGYFAWSESFFMVLILLCLLFLIDYQRRQKVWLLYGSAFLAALASLTRYIGVSIIATGLFVIVVLYSQKKTKLSGGLLFVLFASLPLTVWLLRNWIVTKTLFGTRSLSSFNLMDSIQNTFSIVCNWFYPDIISKNQFLSILPVIFFFALAGFVINRKRKYHSGHLRNELVRIFPISSFVIIYLTLLIYTSTTTAFDPIDDRLLAPVFPFVVVLVLYFFENAICCIKGSSLRNIVLLSSLFFLVVPMYGNYLRFSCRFSRQCAVLNNKAWQNSETLKYASTLKPESIYTNSPDVIYLFTNMRTNFVPRKKPGSNTLDPEVDIYEFKWPPADGYLVWFNNSKRDYLFLPEELALIANISPVAQLSDGTIYSISRK